MATTESLNRLSRSPLADRSICGPGLPTVQYTRFNPGSYEPVSHIGLPPSFQLSPFHVSLPNSPGPGTEYQRHNRRPVAASYASRNPRAPNSPPVMPTRTLSFTTSGGLVML